MILVVFSANRISSIIYTATIYLISEHWGQTDLAGKTVVGAVSPHKNEWAQNKLRMNIFKWSADLVVFDLNFKISFTPSCDNDDNRWLRM